ncbi:hypothetical protein UFOVP245_102 [uncultured Caudovirales phage]|uniref:Uncharacterized protein n=1 Tax=uncultured Caudovirales phage TaxID=2100421 RepID=A0A6J7WU16_9CAUD|nr:hypothetical protein UFOVP245_102 [uncultured Caudovirales phage]
MSFTTDLANLAEISQALSKDITANTTDILSISANTITATRNNFANTDGTVKVHLVYNNSTNSLDTVFE